MNRKLVSIIAMMAFFTGASPALADELLAATPSGTAEMLFPTKANATVQAISSKCIDVRWTVITSTFNEVVCESPLSMGQSVLGQMLMGNSYSTPPRRFFRFNVAEVNGLSRVQASGWMELQMAFGQMKRTDFSGATFQNNILAFLASAGGRFPVGTTFPNHVVLGIDADDATYEGRAALRVKTVSTDSVGAKAGLVPGDLVVKIAGRRWKDFGEYLDATAKAADTTSYPVEVVRGGKVVTLAVERAFRPPVTETIVAATASNTEVAQPALASGVADELRKLAKLRDDGIITAAEFEAQKKKVLGQ